MKQNRLFWLLTTAPALLVPFSSGCSYIAAPEPDPVPTEAPTPKAPYFDPAAGQPQGFPLNGNPLIPGSPAFYRVTSAITGDSVAIQSVAVAGASTAAPAAAPSSGSVAAAPGVPANPSAARPATSVTTTGTPVAPKLGPPETVHLAGIIAASTDPGLQGARTAIAKWTAGQDVDVHRDPKFPNDLDKKQIVEVFFTGGKGTATHPSPYEGQKLSLNRMLVRSGWAVVDMYSPTTFDTSQWVFDEAHAKRMHLGIWATGQVIQQRVVPKIMVMPKSKSKVTIGKPNIARLSPTPLPGATPGAAAPGAAGAGVPGAAPVAPSAPGGISSAPGAGSTSSAAPSALR